MILNYLNAGRRPKNATKTKIENTRIAAAIFLILFISSSDK